MNYRVKVNLCVKYLYGKETSHIHFTMLLNKCLLLLVFSAVLWWVRTVTIFIMNYLERIKQKFYHLNKDTHVKSLMNSNTYTDTSWQKALGLGDMARLDTGAAWPCSHPRFQLSKQWLVFSVATPSSATSRTFKL